MIAFIEELNDALPSTGEHRFFVHKTPSNIESLGVHHVTYYNVILAALLGNYFLMSSNISLATRSG